MPSHLPSSGRATKAGPLPSGGVLVAALDGTTSPSDSLSARRRFAFGLSAPPSPDVGRRGGSLLSPVELSSRAFPPTPEGSCAAPARPPRPFCGTPRLGATRSSDADHGLRRDVIGSAPSLVISRGCRDSRTSIGPRPCSLPGLAAVRLSTPRSGAAISPRSWGLLRGAPALTAAGLSPASSTEWEAKSVLTFVSSGHATAPILHVARPE